MILYLIYENDKYDILPYQIKSFNMNSEPFEHKYIVQLGETKIENEYLQKFGGERLDVPASIKTYKDAINQILYTMHISVKKNNKVIFVNDSIFLTNFKFQNFRRSKSGSIITVDTSIIDEDFLVDDAKYVYMTGGVQRTHYTTYREGFIEFDDNIEYIKNKFNKFLPNILKTDSVITMGKRFLKENKKFRRAGKPTRTKEEHNDILNNICKPCEQYNKGRCKLCGCKLEGFVNKIKYATSHCPINKW